MDKYRECMARAKPAIEAAGGKYLARGGEHEAFEGDWTPRRLLVLLEFPSMNAFRSFCLGPVYSELKAIRGACNSARLVAV
jgi:uncharacterized protein (DUF1330 family)